MTLLQSVKYSWVANLKTGTFLANSRESVRVLGVLTAVGEIPVEDRQLVPAFTRMIDPPAITLNGQGGDSQSVPDMRIMTIDDGTDNVSFWTPKQMIDRLLPDLHLGQTIDCILKLRQNASFKRWFADTIILIHDLKEEQYRWILLSHQQQHCRSDTPLLHLQPSGLTHDLGVPTQRRDASEVFRLIDSHFQIQQKQYKRKEKRTQRRTQYQQWQSRHKNRAGSGDTSQRPAAPFLKGLPLKDLALVIQKPQKEVQEMIFGLQLEGKIYQNSHGDYLPL